jgi:signal transduction histidine kinase
MACALDPSLSSLLFIVYPQIWLFSGGHRAGVVGTVALTAVAASGFIVNLGASVDSLNEVVPEMVVSLLFSLLLGLWMSRVIDQSRQRRALIEQLEATRAELAAAHHAQGVMAERERLAREIHDTVAQGFTSIVMLAQAAAAELGRANDQVASRLAAVEEVARENLAASRALVAALTPVELEGTSLPDAVRRLGERFGRETGVSVLVEVEGAVDGLSRGQQVVLLRAVQEALTNVRRHARASSAVIRLLADRDSALVEIGDDGIGFASGTVEGFGLAGMRGRVRDVGGELDVASRPGGGTRVLVRVPVSAGQA